MRSPIDAGIPPPISRQMGAVEALANMSNPLFVAKATILTFLQIGVKIKAGDTVFLAIPCQ